MLAAHEYKQMIQLKGWKVWRDLTLDWLIIGLSGALVHFYPYPLTYIVSLILVARTQLALSILMHESAHRNLFKNAKLNDFVGQWLIAGPVFFSMYSYKKNHLTHHQIPLQDNDPDITLIGGYPISGKSFLRKLLRDISGLSYIKFIRYFLYGSHRRSREVRSQPLPSEVQAALPAHEKLGRLQISLSIFITNFFLFMLFWWSGRPLDYLLVWILPMMTILQVMLRIRGVAEHAGFGPDKDQMIISRTVVNPLQTFFFAPHGVNFHIEHHAYPKIPYYNLPTVHRLLKERGSLRAANVHLGYGSILKELIQA